MRRLLTEAKSLCACAAALVLLAVVVILSLFRDLEPDESRDWMEWE